MESLPSWKLVFRQTAPYLWEQNLDLIKTGSLGSAGDDNFSILNEINDERTKAEYFVGTTIQFKMIDSKAGIRREMVWTQTTPFVSNTRTLIAVISTTGFTPPTSNEAWAFDGLHEASYHNFRYGLLSGVERAWDRWLIGQVANSSAFRFEPNKLVSIQTQTSSSEVADWVELYAMYSTPAQLIQRSIYTGDLQMEYVASITGDSNTWPSIYTNNSGTPTTSRTPVPRAWVRDSDNDGTFYLIQN